MVSSLDLGNFYRSEFTALYQLLLDRLDLSKGKPFRWLPVIHLKRQKCFVEENEIKNR